MEMDKNLIKQLQAAGVSADTILEIVLKLDGQPEEKPEEKKEEKPEEKKEEKPEEKPAAAAASGDQILKAIEELTGAIYASNIRKDGTASRQENADDILAEVIKGDK